MKDDKTIGDLASSVKDIKVSSIKKAIHNIWKLAVFGALVGFLGAFLYGFFAGYRHLDGVWIFLGLGLTAAFEFFTGKLTAFIFR
jgi:hypothetical protein